MVFSRIEASRQFYQGADARGHTPKGSEPFGRESAKKALTPFGAESAKKALTPLGAR